MSTQQYRTYIIACAAIPLLLIVQSAGAARLHAASRLFSAADTLSTNRISIDDTKHQILNGGPAPCGSQPDEVCSLPGLKGPPHVRLRSGYITVSEVSDRQLWYLLADREEADPENGEPTDLLDSTARRLDPSRASSSPSTTPVVLWLTGGPGCSSLDAFIYEHGPFHFSYGAAAQSGQKEAVGGAAREVVLTPNPYSWTKVASVIYVDSPAGVGMSYSGRPEVDYRTNDEYTIADLVAFLEGLTELYPELATAPFYLAGESYGGVFVPLLARELLRVNDKRITEGRGPLVDLQGYSVGNPVTDDVIDGNAQLFFAADMGYVDPPTWRHMRAACGDMFWNATPGTDCWDVQGVVKDDLWDLNWYDVLEPCTRTEEQQRQQAAGGVQGRDAADVDDDNEARALLRFSWPYTVRMRAPGAEEETEDETEEAGLAAGRRGGRQLWGPWLRHVVPCMDRRIALDWLNRAEVRSALHAAPSASIGEWQPCSDVIRYRLDTMELVPVHEELVAAGIRALVYSGDHDMVVPHTGTRKWLYDLAQLGRPDGPLRPWMMDGQIAGFTARFPEGAGLRFVTVKGAGHMVPQSKPAAALHLLEAFLHDREL